MKKYKKQISNRVDSIINKYQSRPTFNNVLFDRGVYLCDSTYLGESVSMTALPENINGWLLISEREDGDQRIKGMLLGRKIALGDWNYVERHSGDSGCNLVINAKKFGGKESAILQEVKDSLDAEIAQTYKHTRSWGMIANEKIGPIIGICSGYGSGGVSIYINSECMFLDYAGISSQIEMEIECEIPEKDWEI